MSLELTNAGKAHRPFRAERGMMMGRSFMAPSSSHMMGRNSVVNTGYMSCGQLSLTELGMVRSSMNFMRLWRHYTDMVQKWCIHIEMRDGLSFFWGYALTNEKIFLRLLSLQRTLLIP